MDKLILLFFVPVNIILALFILLNNPKSWTNRLFSAFIFALTFYLTVNTELYAFSSFTIKLFFARSISVAGVIINILVFLFLYTFPEDKITLRKIISYPLFVLTYLLALGASIGLVFANIVVNNNVVTPVPGILMPFFLLHTLLLVVGGIIIVFIRYVRSKGIVKNRIKYVILSFIILFLLIIVLNFILPVFFKIGFFVPLLPIYILLFNIIISYAVVKQRFLDIRVVVARTVTYTLLVVTFATFYAFSFIIFGRMIFGVETKDVEVIISTILALIMAFSFQPLRLLFQKLTNRLFYKDNYDSQLLMSNMGKIMATTLDLSNLVEKLMIELFSQMKIVTGSFILVRDSSIIWFKGGGDHQSLEFNEKEITYLIDYATKKNGENVIVFEELTESIEKNIMRKYNIEILLPLIVESQPIGAMLFGQKASGDIYAGNDIEVLKIISPELAIAVKNSLSYDEIKRFNITLEEEVNKATTELQTANIRLKELDKLKDEFVSVASHELRTPMTAIKSYIWMVLNKPGQELNEKLREYLNIAYTSTERLLHLVENMLTISRIEGNRLQLSYSKFDFVKMIDQLHKELIINATEKTIDFKLVTKFKSIPYEGDEDRLREAIQNLVGNALKFTPQKGTITITLDKNNDQVIISIFNSGSYISKANIPKLFGKFNKLEESYTNKTQESGTGLGLYICKQIVEMHKGRIDVTSDENSGTTFAIYLPILKK